MTKDKDILMRIKTNEIILLLEKIEELIPRDSEVMASLANVYLAMGTFSLTMRNYILNIEVQN